MALALELLYELKQEAAVTRKYLESVPFAQAEYRPHEKSEALGRLAIHIAEIVGWWKACLTKNELDFSDFEPEKITSVPQLLAYFDGLMREAEKALAEATDETFEQEWAMRNGETIYFTLPKKQVVRIFCMNHMVHHRAQLGVYLRLLGVPVPATYGPSADDEDVILTNKFE